MYKGDPYLYDNVNVLKNKLNIKNTEELDKAESLISNANLLNVDEVLKNSKLDFQRLLDIHKHIFKDIYEWAGETRTISIVKGESVLGGDTVRYEVPDNIKNHGQKVINELNDINWRKTDLDKKALQFSKLIAELWQVHPFREGNTRTVITFAAQFAEAKGFKLDKKLLAENNKYLRDSLVKASDGPYSDYHYLTRIIKDSMMNGMNLQQSEKNSQDHKSLEKKQNNLSTKKVNHIDIEL